MNSQNSLLLYLPQFPGLEFAKWVPGRWGPVLHVLQEAVLMSWGLPAPTKALLRTAGARRPWAESHPQTSANLIQTRYTGAWHMLCSVPGKVLAEKMKWNVFTMSSKLFSNQSNLDPNLVPNLEWPDFFSVPVHWAIKWAEQIPLGWNQLIRKANNHHALSVPFWRVFRLSLN